MDLQDYIREVTRSELTKLEIIKRVKGRIVSVNNDDVTIQINIPAANITKDVTIINTSGMTVEVGNIVWVYYWKNIADGWILPANMKSGGVGEFINEAHNSERFNDYVGNVITGNQTNEYCSLTGYENSLVSDGIESAIFNTDILIGSGNQIKLPDYTGYSKYSDNNILIGTDNKSLAKETHYNMVVGRSNTINSYEQGGEYYGNRISYSTVIGIGNTISAAVLTYPHCFMVGNANEYNHQYSVAPPVHYHRAFMYGYANRITATGVNDGVLVYGVNNYYRNITPLDPTAYKGNQTMYGVGGTIDYQYNQNAVNIAIAFGRSDNRISLHTTNGMELDHDGNLTVLGTINSNSGSDFAEYEEWADGNPNNEDRCGLFVVDNEDYIELANSDTLPEDILGVVSANPTICGGSYGICWKGTYQKDIFGRVEHQETEIEIDGETRTTIEEIQNPEAYKDKSYNNRANRPEFSPIAYVGKVIMIDDGSCEINGYCKSINGGIATKSETKTRFKVRKRIDDTHILVRIL